MRVQVSHNREPERINSNDIGAREGDLQQKEALGRHDVRIADEEDESSTACKGDEGELAAHNSKDIIMKDLLKSAAEQQKIQKG